jgi:hypothetical protein
MRHSGGRSDSLRVGVPGDGARGCDHIGAHKPRWRGGPALVPRRGSATAPAASPQLVQRIGLRGFDPVRQDVRIDDGQLRMLPPPALEDEVRKHSIGEP